MKANSGGVFSDVEEKANGSWIFSDIEDEANGRIIIFLNVEEEANNGGGVCSDVEETADDNSIVFSDIEANGVTSNNRVSYLFFTKILTKGFLQIRYLATRSAWMFHHSWLDLNCCFHDLMKWIVGPL